MNALDSRTKTGAEIWGLPGAMGRLAHVRRCWLKGFRRTFDAADIGRPFYVSQDLIGAHAATKFAYEIGELLGKEFVVVRGIKPGEPHKFMRVS